MSTKKTDVTAPKSTERELQIIAKLAKNGPQTRAELGLHSSGDHWILIDSMEKAGVVKLRTRKTGKRGRPAHEIVLDKKGRDRARSKTVQSMVAALA